jgi:hypothetical protein
MNDFPQDIADELARLKPRPGGRQLEDRISRELESPLASTPRPVVVRFRYASAVRWAAAALFVLAAGGLALYWTNRPQSAQPSMAGTERPGSAAAASNPDDATLRPLRQANYLIDAEERGLFYPQDDTPWRKVKWQYVSVSDWRDDRSQSTVRVVVPREELIVMPVNFR